MLTTITESIRVKEKHKEKELNMANTNTLKQGKVFQEAGILQDSEMVLVWDNDNNCVDTGYYYIIPDLRTKSQKAVSNTPRLIAIPMANCEELGEYLFKNKLEVIMLNSFGRFILNLTYNQKHIITIQAKNETDARAQAVEWGLKNRGL